MSAPSSLHVVYNPVIIGCDGRKLLPLGYYDYGIAFVDPHANKPEQIETALDAITPNHAIDYLNKEFQAHHAGKDIERVKKKV